MNIGLRALSLVLLPLAGAMIWAYRALRWDADRLHGALTALRQAFPARPGAAPATDQPADDREQMRLAAREALRALQRDMIPEGRRGYIQDVGGFSIFVDDDYAEVIRRSLVQGSYERRERELVKEFLAPGDRVIEAGTAIGLVAMTAASIVGADNVVTFDANPDMIADARDNFRRNDLSRISSRVGALVNARRFSEGATAELHLSRSFWTSRLDARDGAPDIVGKIRTPIFCLEQEIAAQRANVLICDIEGGEVELLSEADLAGIRLVILETHYWAAGEAATDALVRRLMAQGFSLHLGASAHSVLVFRRLQARLSEELSEDKAQFGQQAMVAE